MTSSLFTKAYQAIFHKMEESHYRAVIEYMLKNGFKGKKIHDDLTKTYGECASSDATTKRLISLLKHGRKTLKDVDKPGRPSSSFAFLLLMLRCPFMLGR